MGFLPVTLSEIKKLGVQQADFIIVTGDAYVDHPSFGAAIIGRLLESLGYVIGIIAQPDWKNIESFKKLGKPKYAFMVTGGNIDSMVNHYSVAKKRRHTEVYSPGGKVGLRPDRASIVYSNKIREAYKDAFIVLGGIEASLRRLAHYDYWDDTVRRSILVDSGADILIYGMAETQVEELAEGLKSNFDIKKIRGICYKAKTAEGIENSIVLPSFVKVSRDKDKYCESFMLQYNNSHGIIGKTLIEPYPSGFVVQTPPALPISTAKFDKVYALPYMKAYHPDYESQGGVPAISEVKFSIISNRGCFGSCNFCALTFHQGRVVQARSHASILKEAGEFKWDSDFKGYIHDVGGPTANFRKPACKKQLSQGPCINKECLFPTPCENLDTSHEDYLKLLKSLREVDGVKKVFVRSGIRYDYLLEDTNGKFLKELVKHHISGQLKVAPEHISDKVLEKMGKPGRNVYKKFCEKYAQINNSLGMKQFLVPYFMSSHPGSDLAAAVELAEYLRDTGFTPEQVQDFYPTPGTLSTCMYFTGKDPRTMKTVYVPKTSHEKTLQRALMQYKNPKNYYLVRDALINAGREDLIGDGNRCLISHKPFVAPKVNKSKKVGDKTVIDNKGKYNVSKSKSQKKKTIRNIHKSKKS